MPIEYKLDSEQSCLLIRYSGEVSFQQLLELVERGQQLPELRHRHFRLSDLRAVTQFPQTTETRSFAEMVVKLDEMIPPERTAIVADTDLAYGIMRAFLAKRDPDNEMVRLCRGMDEAIQWLDLSYPGGDPFAPEYWDDGPVVTIP